MMSENIILKKNPKIEFQLLENGFELIDEQTERNSDFYFCNDLQFIDLNKVWFPGTAKMVKNYYLDIKWSSIFSGWRIL